MGYAIVPDIKDEGVACQKACAHRDCQLTREEWGNAKCAICGKPMRAGQAYYRDERGHVHAACLWDENERNAAKVA